VVDLNAAPRPKAAETVRAAGGPCAPIGKVITELSLPYWVHLHGAHHEKRL
jgi:hypothetical protein